MSKVDLINLTINEMKARGDFHGHTYSPFYAASYALHAFNLLNFEKKLYYESKQIPNMRLHLLFVGPPMSSKTYYLEHMSQSENALFSDTGFEMAAKGTLTEAGLCGTYRSSGGSSEKRMGEAEKHAKGFLTIDEFSALSEAYGQSYNASLEAQLLQALDHGNVSKDLGAGPTISFRTHCTIWGGIQPRKLHMENDAGLGRRICFLVNIPTEEQRKQIRTAMFRSKNVAPQEGEVEDVHDQIWEWREKLDNIERIQFDESILDWYIDKNTDPLHQPLSDRIILGYHLARGNFDHELYLNLDDQILRNMVTSSQKWFHDVRMGTELMLIKNVIKSYGDSIRDEGTLIKKTDLIKLASTISMTQKEMISSIDEMISLGMLELNKLNQTLSLWEIKDQ